MSIDLNTIKGCPRIKLDKTNNTIFILGVKGSGKTSLIDRMIYDISQHKHCGCTEIYYSKFCNGELQEYDIFDLEREKVKKYNKQELFSFVKRHTECDKCPKVIFIDKHDLDLYDTSVLCSIVEGTSVHLVISSTTLSIIPRSSIILALKTSSNDSMDLIGSKALSSLTCRGLGMIKLSGGVYPFRYELDVDNSTNKLKKVSKVPDSISEGNLPYKPEYNKNDFFDMSRIDEEIENISKKLSEGNISKFNENDFSLLVKDILNNKEDSDLYLKAALALLELIKTRNVDRTNKNDKSSIVVNSKYLNSRVINVLNNENYYYKKVTRENLEEFGEEISGI